LAAIGAPDKRPKAAETTIALNFRMVNSIQEVPKKKNARFVSRQPAYAFGMPRPGFAV
jgi:hypothetical protein